MGKYGNLSEIKDIQSERLSRLFDDVWKRIPPRSKGELLKRLWYVTDHDPPFYVPLSSEDTKHLYARTYCDDDLGAIFLVSENLAELDDDEVRGVIAHELAHAYLDHPCNAHVDEQQREIDADNLAERWGFESYGEMGYIFKMWEEKHANDTPNDTTTAQ